MMFRRRSKESIVEDERKLDQKVTKAQTRAEKIDKRSIKLLILGGGGSGKTTLRKQFSRLYANAFKDAKVRVDLKEVIIHNLIEGMKATIVATDTFSGGLKDPHSIKAATMIKDLGDDISTINEELAQAFRTLHHDPVIKEILEIHRSKYQLQECFVVYFDRVQSYPEWGGPIWIPSEDDCVRSRIRSSGIIELDFEHERTKFRVFDAGGQRAERRKWLHAFDDVTALIFVSALTEYDEVLFEDKTKNRLLESLEVWEDLVNSSHFLTVPVLLFLNKLDLFEDKYVRRKIPLNVTGLFPDAPSGEPDIPIAIEWITAQFKKRRTKADPSLLFVHTIAAVDVNQVDTVFKDVKEIVLLRIMAQQGLT